MGFKLFEGYLLRIPTYSFSYFQDIQSMDSDELFKQFEDPFIKESLFLASPLLFSRLNNLSKLNKRDKDKVWLSFFKYLIRLSTRPTPFGFFAGNCFGTDLGERTEYLIEHKSKHSKFVRISVNTVMQMATLIQNYVVFPNLVPLYVNNSLYKSPFGNYRYFKTSFSKGNKKSEIINLGQSPFIDRVIKLAEEGVTSIDLCKIFGEEFGFSEAEIISFVKELLENQVLYCGIQPSLISRNSLEDLKIKLCEFGIQDLKEVDTVFNCIEHTIRLLTRNPTLQNIKDSEKLLEQLPIELNSKIFHSDLFIGSRRTCLNRKVLEKVERFGINVLARLVTINKTPIVVLKEEMLKRHGNQEVKLTDVLDPLYGIGYNENRNLVNINPLLEGIDFETPRGAVKISKLDELLLGKVVEFQSSNNVEIELTECDLLTLDENHELLPDTFNIFFSIIDDKKELIAIKVASSITAAGYISRFAYMNKDIENLVNDIYDYEKELHPECLVAEVIHQPTQDVGNIILKSSSRENEIQFLIRGSESCNRVIDINDLFLHVNVNDELVLTSKKYNKRVLPRFSSGYNYMMTEFPIFRFLCDLQSGRDHLTGLEFIWGDIFESFSFLPRITHQNIIYSPAIWRIKEEPLEQLKSIIYPKVNFVGLSEFRKERKIPRYVLYGENENDLLLDLTLDNSLYLLQNLIRQKKSIILKEFFFSDDNTLIKEFGHVNEFIVSMKSE